MLSDGGDSAAAGAAAQATANTNAQPTGTADAEQQTEPTNHYAMNRQLDSALANWRESEAENCRLKHALRRLVHDTRAIATGLKPGKDIHYLVRVADQLAKANLPEDADSDDEAGAASAKRQKV